MKSLSHLVALSLAVAAGTVAAQSTFEFRKVQRGLEVAPPSQAPAPSPAPAPAPTLTAQTSAGAASFAAKVEASDSKQVMLLNTGTGTLSISNVSVSGAAFSASTTCGATLAPGASCAATVTFSPTAAQSYNGSLVFTTNASPAVPAVTLSGTGQIAQGSLTAVTSANFETVNVGQTADRSFVFSNTGTALAENVYAQLAGANLTLTTNTCGTAASPVSLAVGAQCNITVRYAPTATGNLSGTLSVLSDAGNGTQSLALSGSATPAADASASSVSVLLKAENTALMDSSVNGIVMTATNQARVVTTDARFGTGSIYLDGTDDWYTSATSNGFGFGTGDFTIELWAKHQTSGEDWLIDFRLQGSANQDRPHLARGADGRVNYFVGTEALISVSSPATNVWRHYAVTRTGGTTRLFIDGTLVGSTSVARSNANFGTSSRFVLGTVGDAPGYMNTDFQGWMDEVRVTKGVARYTGNFTAPTEAFPAVGPTINIVSATYGGNRGAPAGNRTAFVGGLCNGLTVCSLPGGSLYSAAAGGDPAPNLSKDLSITYTCGGVAKPTYTMGAEAGIGVNTLTCP